MNAPGGSGLAGARLCVIAAFVISRLVYYFVAGIRFDSRPLTSYLQLVEPYLLRDRLWESLYNLHMQPPGFNLMAGLVLKVFPDMPGPALHAIYLLAGLTVALCTHELMRLLGVPLSISTPLAILFTISPGIVLFENLLIYDYLSLVQLLVAALLFYRFVDRPTAGTALAFQLAMLSLMLVRNSFHLPYYLLLTGVMWWRMTNSRRLIAVTAALPLVIITALHAKNFALVGQFTTSTWQGQQAAFITTMQLSAEERQSLHKAGLLSAVGVIGPEASLDAYKPYITMPKPTGIPVLDLERGKSGRPNFNNPAFLEVQRYFIDDAKSILWNYPKAYGRSVVRAWFCYFLPLGDFPQFTLNRHKIVGWDRFFNLVVFGQLREAQPRRNLRTVQAEHGALAILPYAGLSLAAGIPFLFVFGLWRLWSGVRQGSLSEARAALLAFLLYHVASLTALFNFLSCFDNNRYRVAIDGFFVVLAGMALAAAASRLRQWRRPKPVEVTLSAAAR